MTHRMKWTVVALSVLAVLTLIAVQVGARIAERRDKGSDKAPVALEFAPAEVTQPRRESLPLTIEFSGPLVSPRTAVVRAKEPGTLLSLAVREGERVKAGQRLGTLDLTSLTSRLAERNAMLESAQVALAQAQRQHEANERLAKQEFISANALESSRVALEAARAQLKSAQAQLASTRVGLNEATLVSPIDGVVAKRHVVAGEKLAMEQQVLTIVDLSKLELAGTVGMHEVSRLAPGMAVSLSIEGWDKPVQASIARIAPSAEPGSRAIGVVVELPNPGERLRAGQYAVARVQIADEQQRLTVPAAAVGSTGGQDHVWTIENGALVRRAVTLGRRDAARGRVEVLQGLDERATVLALRFDNLKEGARAKAVTAAGPAASAPAASVAATAASAAAR